MNKTRLEAFSDGVIAILITIMVLELRIPHGSDAATLAPLFSPFLSYVLSFIYLGIYWNNHHHLLNTIRHVRGGILWANLHLLFWLSLVPATTGWIGDSHFENLPMAVYGFVLLMAAIAYYILQTIILKIHGKESLLAKAIGKDLKGKISPVLYVIGICAAAFSPLISGAIYVLVAFIWLIPDKRIENRFSREGSEAREGEE